MLTTGVASAERLAAELTEAAERAALEKFDRLNAILREMNSVLVAFSGGVDSTFLLKAASLALPGKAAALTATSPTYPEREFKEACSLAAAMGVEHVVVESNELEIPNFAENTEKRCYYCKSELFDISTGRAEKMGLKWAADGSNADDSLDYRPGRAAAAERSVRSPLAEAGLTKVEIRFLSRRLGLPTWDKPSFACLSSRFPYGTRITEENLRMVDEAEEFLHDLGFRQFRVRYHGPVARIEPGAAELSRFMDDAFRLKVVEGLKRIGFTYVTLDLQGYRTGSMNEVLSAG